MMKKALGAVLFVLLSACAGISVNSDFAADYDFAGVSTFAWLPRPAIAESASGADLDNDLVRQRVTDAVDAQLAAKGLSRVLDGVPASVLVTYHLAKEEKVNFNSFGSWYTHFAYYPCYYCDYRPGYGRGYFGHGHFYDDDIWVRSYEESSLIIDIIDAKSKKLVWRGTSKRVMPSMETPEERRVYINETVAAVLAKFPPGIDLAP
ncbi:DUF4136 domain-containing protein [Zhongshania sp.]|uniref:DUF4136 domain-containing protein n=1 Tax=Zhongshania sp. TaxID=1971902 RepID=UPI00356B5DD4